MSSRRWALKREKTRNHRLWTSISDARICKRCSVNQTSFHFPTVYSHFSLIFLAFWSVACSVRCGAFIQCGGESATDLRAARYRARANWIGPEPDSVLRSVRSLVCCSSFPHFGTFVVRVFPISALHNAPLINPHWALWTAVKPANPGLKTRQVWIP